MRLALVSDLHVDITQKNWELVPLIAELLRIIADGADNRVSPAVFGILDVLARALARIFDFPS